MDSAWYWGQNRVGISGEGGRDPEASFSPAPSRDPIPNLVGAVGEVESRNVHPGFDHLLEALYGARCRPWNQRSHSDNFLPKPETSQPPTTAPSEMPRPRSLTVGSSPTPARKSETPFPSPANNLGRHHCGGARRGGSSARSEATASAVRAAVWV